MVSGKFKIPKYAPGSCLMKVVAKQVHFDEFKDFISCYGLFWQLYDQVLIETLIELNVHVRFDLVNFG